MRRVLILGGTGWLGGRIAAAAVAAGAEVHCLARGESGAVPEGARLLSADRRATDSYEAATGDWDEVVEIAHEPGLVEPALAALEARAAHWTLISTVSVYASDAEPHADEQAELVEPSDPARYADAKVLAERRSGAALGDRLLVARPGLIAGPGDPSDRLGYWPARFTRGGTVLLPPTAARSVQPIDVDDLAAWVERAGRQRMHGAVNAVGPAHPLGAFLAAAAEIAGFDGPAVELDERRAESLDVRYWAGPRSLPLWLPDSAPGFARRSGAAFSASGGTSRPLAELLVRVLSDELRRGVERPRRSGITPEEERSVLEGLENSTLDGPRDRSRSANPPEPHAPRTATLRR